MIILIENLTLTNILQTSCEEHDFEESIKIVQKERKKLGYKPIQIDVDDLIVYHHNAGLTAKFIKAVKYCIRKAKKNGWDNSEEFQITNEIFDYMDRQMGFKVSYGDLEYFIDEVLRKKI